VPTNTSTTTIITPTTPTRTPTTTIIPSPTRRGRP
jgi:hypothetical protein